MTHSQPGPGDLPILLFAAPQEWSAWLEQNHSTARGVWLRLAKKGAALISLSYAEALDEALCHGWIDGQKRSFDAESWLQKFTPRGRRSLWSKINREKVEALTRAGRMRAAGLAAVESARQDGRWDAAYDSQRSSTVPEDLQSALEARPRAKEFLATLDRANRYAVLFRIQTARRPETRAKRIAALVEMLERGERPHP